MNDSKMTLHQKYIKVKETAKKLENKALRKEYAMKYSIRNASPRPPSRAKKSQRRNAEWNQSMKLTSGKKGLGDSFNDRSLLTPQKRAFGGGLGTDTKSRDALDLTELAADETEEVNTMLVDAIKAKLAILDSIDKE